jgi:Family of unknown function (DUF6101)
MLDEARPVAGLDYAWSSPAGGTPVGADCRAFVGATGEILVTRAVAGVRITSPEKRSSFTGVILKVPSAGKGARYAIVLASKLGADDIVLEQCLREHEVVARWRAIASSLGLPALILHADGELEYLQIQLGGIIVGSADTDRRRNPSRNRRPRFLMRRKSGRLATVNG